MLFSNHFHFVLKIFLAWWTKFSAFIFCKLISSSSSSLSLSSFSDGTHNVLYKLQRKLLSTFFSPFLQNEYSEQWALACGEILRVLTHYNRPIYKMEQQNSDSERSSSGCHATTSDSSGESSHHIPLLQQERKPLRPLSPWITDILLAAPLGIRSDYFRWWVRHLEVA